MNKILKTIKKLGLYIWQLPQNIVGLITYSCYDGYNICTPETCKSECIRCKLSTKMRGGISLGNYIILSNRRHLKHELGHTVQSKYLGPAYLLVVGLWSIIDAAISKNHSECWCEKWANKLSDKHFKNI